MTRPLAASLAALFLVAATAVAQPARDSTRAVSRDGWNDPRTLELVTRATERRARALADTGLRDYKAAAHGYLLFLGQAGDTMPPRVITAGELALQVYWRAPNLSKQVIQGRRDTTLLPNNNAFHRDHLGIVQNNFPAIIRLGEGDEVRDVPHPLSQAGLREYDYAIRDSVRLRLPDRTIQMYEVRVRPKDDRQARVIGALYLDPETADVVRMAFNFTRAAFIDRRLEDLAIVLESGLVAGRYWLPRRQEVEIRRTTTWMDFPVLTIIRGRWEIADYEINVGLTPAMFAGEEIVDAPAAEQRRHAWDGRILDALPTDVLAPNAEEVQRVQAEARELVRAQALERARSGTLSARRISDFIRINRVEGLAVGLGAVRGLAPGVDLRARARYGVDDREPKGRLSLQWRRASGLGLELFGERDYRDASDVRETSSVRNSLAAQEFGSDYTEPYDAVALGAAFDLGTRLGVRWRLEGAREHHNRLRVHARPSSGRYEPTIPALDLDGVRASLLAERPARPSVLGTTLRLGADLRLLDVTHAGGCPRCAETSGRAVLTADAQRAFGRRQLLLSTTLGAVSRLRGSQGLEPPPQELVFLGGPSSGPGYAYHQFAARLGASQRVELRTPVPFVAIPFGEFGRAPAAATLAPFVNTVYVSRLSALRPDARAGWYPSVGVGALMLFDIIRLDVARGLRDGRWTFSADVSRDWWGIL